jgi:flagellin-specific chaperone FliS
MKETAVDYEKFMERNKLERAAQEVSENSIHSIAKLLRIRVVIARRILTVEEGSESYEELLKLYDYVNKEISLILAI